MNQSAAQSTDTSSPGHLASRPTSVPRFVEGPNRQLTKTVDLAFPIEFEGVVYHSVTVRRGTVGEWRRYFEQVAAGDDAFMPFFSAPREVMDALDSDDDAKVLEAVDDFFPQRYRQSAPVAEASAPRSSTGEQSPQE